MRRSLLIPCAAALLSFGVSAQERLGSYERTLESLTSPTAVALDELGDLIAIANPQEGAVLIQRIDPNGSIDAAPITDSRLGRYPILLNKKHPTGLAFSPDGRLWITDSASNKLCS